MQEVNASLSGAEGSLPFSEIHGRGLHSSTSQLNLSRFRRKIHPEHPLVLLKKPRDTP